MIKVLRYILLVINALFALALIVSTLAGRIAPDQMAAVSILSYGYFLLVLINVVFILVWLFLSRWEFLLSATAIVVRFSFLPLFFQVGGTLEVSAAADNVKVMTFNSHNFAGLDSDTLMTKDSGAVLFLSILDEEEPDVLCIQECFAPCNEQVNLIDSLKARGYRHYYGVHGDNPKAASLLFSRCRIVQGHDMDHKSKFYADIVKNGHKFRVCCVHLDSYQLGEADKASLDNLTGLHPDSSTHKLVDKFVETTRRHQAEWNDELLPLIEKTKVPIIVAGDFNDTPASYIYQQITHHLNDPYVEQGRGFGTTYHGPFPAFRIDFIFHSPELEALSYKRVKTNISDHYPIVAQFQFPNQP